jgi:hypothetical protein
MGSASEGVRSHRQNDPVEEADELEPKGKGYGAGSRKPDRSALPRNPVESIALRMRAMGTGNGVTPSSPGQAGAGANRMASGKGFLKQPKPGVISRIC